MNTMSTEDDASKTFLVGIKLALLRHCIMTRTEEELCFSMVKRLLDMMKHPQNSLADFYKATVDGLDDAINARINRLLSLVKHMREIDQSVEEEYKAILNLQTRWESETKNYENLVSLLQDLLKK